MRVLLTGAGGFLGRNVIAFLEKEHVAAEIFATDLAIPQDCASTGKVAWEPLDVCDGGSCIDTFRRLRPTHVLHAAAITLGEQTRESDRRMMMVNLLGTCHVMDAARSVGSVKRCIVVSSSGVYGPGVAGEFCDETHALDLAGTYAWTKRQAELEMELRSDNGAMSSAAARVGPVYGPHEYIRSSRPHVSLVQQLTDALCDGRRVQVAGTECTRDWTHAADVAASLTSLLQSPGLRERVYNVSSGVAVRSRDLLTLFTEFGLHVEWTKKVEEADIVLRPEQSRSALRVERLQRDTGFIPRYDLRSGIADVIARTRERRSSLGLRLPQTKVGRGNE